MKYNFYVVKEILSGSCITSGKDGPKGQEEGAWVYFVLRYLYSDSGSFYNL